MGEHRNIMKSNESSLLLPGWLDDVILLLYFPHFKRSVLGAGYTVPIPRLHIVLHLLLACRMHHSTRICAELSKAPQWFGSKMGIFWLRKVFVMCNIPGCMRVWLHIIYTSTYISAYIWCVYQLMPMSMCILTSWICSKCYTMASPRLLEYTVRTEFPWAQMPQAWISWDFFGASKLDWRRLQGYTIEN